MSVLSYIPYFHEQHHLFLFSKSYFINTVRSAGLLAYITNFIIQFFYYPWLGSLLLALLLSSIYVLIAYITRRITGNTDSLHLGIIPVVYLFIQTLSVDYDLSSIVASLLPLSVIALAVTFFYGRRKYPIAIVVCSALICFVPWEIITGAIVVIIVTLLSILSAYGMRNLKKKRSLIIVSLAIIVYSGVGFYFFTKKFNAGEKYMTLAKKTAGEKKWSETIEITERYLASGRKNLLMLYYRNIALFHTGRLGDDMLNMPQTFGHPSLCFHWRGNSRDTEYGHDAYNELKHWNAAQRWAFEAMVVWGETAPCLINLAKCNIMIERKAVAQKYINILKQSVFYRKTANVLEKELSLLSDDEYTSNDSKVDSPGNNIYSAVEDSRKRDVSATFSGKDDILWDLEMLCDQNPDNKMAIEYFMNALLLNNYIIDFAQNLYRIKNFDYKKMPRIYDEALCICKMMEYEEFEKLGVEVMPETEARFQRYFELYKQGNRVGLKREFESSYWYYIHFVSPKGNQLFRQEKHFRMEVPQGGLEH